MAKYSYEKFVPGGLSEPKKKDDNIEKICESVIDKARDKATKLGQDYKIENYKTRLVVGQVFHIKIESDGKIYELRVFNAPEMGEKSFLLEVLEECPINFYVPEELRCQWDLMTGKKDEA